MRIGRLLASAAMSLAACAAWSAPQIMVDQPDALVSTPLQIRLTGFPAGQPVTVTATMLGADSLKWRSRAVFAADSAGNVDVATAAPLSGSYQGASPMGLIWSMERLPGAPSALPPQTGFAMPSHVEFDAVAADGARAATRVTRRIAAPGVTRHVINEAGVVGTLFLPPGGGKRPAVIVLSGSGGGVFENRAALLASHGYAALALGYFRAPGLPQGLVNIPLEYFENAIGWMRTQPWLDDGFLAVMGISRGGELALLLGSTFTDINAVVAYVPSGVMHGPFGPSEPGDMRPRAAWTLRGQPLPYLQQDNRSGDASSINRTLADVIESPWYLTLLRDTAAVERSAIPVERIKGPVLMISGKDDAMWPSFQLAQIAQRRLQERRHPFPVLHLAYDNAGHLISAPYFPMADSAAVTHPVNGRRYATGGTPRGNAEASVDSWGRMLLFLEQARSARNPQ